MHDVVALDAALLARASSGEPHAWQTLVDTYSAPLYRHAYRLLGERNAAEDVVQDTFLRLWKIAHKWEPKAPARAWLFKVADNLARDALRKRRPTFALIDDEPDLDPGPEAQTVAAFELAELRRRIDELPERQRTALLLCRMEGLSMQEAATALACSVESVEALLARARRTLRTRMDRGDAAEVRTA